MYVRVVQDMYEGSVTAVGCAVGMTDGFKMEVESEMLVILGEGC